MRILVVLLCCFIFCCFVNCAMVTSSPLIGVLYQDVTSPVTFDPGSPAQAIEILGPVQGTAKASSVLGLFATGDASVETAYKRALQQNPQANDLINVTVDYNSKSVLGIYASFTTIVEANAIKRHQVEDKE